MTSRWPHGYRSPVDLSTTCRCRCRSRVRVSPTGSPRFDPILVDACGRCGDQQPVHPDRLDPRALAWLTRWNRRAARDRAQLVGTIAGNLFRSRAGLYAAHRHHIPGRTR